MQMEKFHFLKKQMRIPGTGGQGVIEALMLAGTRDR